MCEMLNCCSRINTKIKEILIAQLETELSSTYWKRMSMLSMRARASVWARELHYHLGWLLAWCQMAISSHSLRNKGPAMTVRV